MTEVISVRFNSKGKFYFFDPAGIEAKQGDNVIVETSKGLEYAECTYGNHMVDDSSVIPPLRPLVRVATAADDKRAADNKQLEKRAFDQCQKKIADYKLDMKLVDVEYSFEGTKILFFFTSEGRVDFRELVKDLASVFKTRIELRQIGVRDEARMIGGLGICGKPFCCSQFLNDFHPVSIKMAKTQGLSLNPTKISGTCGRLMCCLKYEEAAYEDLVKRAPKHDAFVETPAGKGSVLGVNLLRGLAKVRLEDGTDTSLKSFPFEELDILGGKARRQEYIAARAEGRLEEAGFKPSAPQQRTRLVDSLEPTQGGKDRRPRPSAPREEQDSAAGQGQNKNRNRRRGGRGRGNGQGQPKPQAENQQKQAANQGQKPQPSGKPQQQQGQRPPQKKQEGAPGGTQPASADSGDKKPSRNRRRGGRGRSGKPAGENPGGSAPKPGGTPAE